VCSLLVWSVQLRDESLLEDVQTVLDLAEVPGLFGNEELEAVLAELRALAASAGRDPDSSMRAWFVERVTLNLHFVFAFSPIGVSLRNRLRVCPALATCTTVDWFDEWPLDALQALAFAELRELPGVEPTKLEYVVDACVHAHISATAMAKRYYEELRRVVHVTPTHYIELLALVSGALSINTARNKCTPLRTADRLPAAADACAVRARRCVRWWSRSARRCLRRRSASTWACAGCSARPRASSTCNTSLRSSSPSSSSSRCKRTR
jgi:hypothetical protein